MGWSGGDEVVDPVIKELDDIVHRGLMYEDDATAVLTVLIRACQGRGWDTEDETLGVWNTRMWVIEAFQRCEIYIPCQVTGIVEEWDRKTSAPKSVEVECGLPRGHIIDHFDEEENLEWPISSLL